MNKKQTIGLMMVVRNESKRIKDCLEWHLPFVDEVAICDQESDDNTVEIVNQCFTNLAIKCQLITDKKWGYCEPSKQKTADLLTTDWILYVDADEKFPKVFLADMHNLITTDEVDGFMFPRINIFEVKVFDDNVPIVPKWLNVTHPAKDPQLRLTRKSISTFPAFLHHRVRIFRSDGQRYFWTLKTYPIEHRKTIQDQWSANKRYGEVNHKEVKNV